MATTFAAVIPIAYGSGQLDEPETVSLPFTTTPLVGDILVAPAGSFATGANNPAAVAALCDMNSTDIYFNVSANAGGNTMADNNPFGLSNAGTALQPGFDATQLKGILFRNNQMVEASLIQAFAQANIAGAVAGFDLTTNTPTWTLSTAVANKICNIVNKVYGPNKGIIGDFYSRVLFTVIPADLQI